LARVWKRTLNLYTTKNLVCAGRGVRAEVVCSWEAGRGGGFCVFYVRNGGCHVWLEEKKNRRSVIRFFTQRGETYS